MHIDIVTGIFVVFLVSAVLLYFLGKFKIPSIVSLIITGVVLSNVGILRDNYLFNEISSLGMMLMLFFIGVEFSFKILWEYRKEAIIGGVTQVLFTTVPVFILVFFISDYKVAFLISFTIAMSSTAVLVGVIESKSAFDTTYGRISFLISLVQDIVGILVLASLPFVISSKPFDVKVGLGFLIFAVYVVFLYYFIKTKFSDALALRNRYLIVFLAIVISFGSGVVSRLCGLSHLLGSFIAGVIISGTFFGRQIASEILPIKEIFVGFFFVYIGSLLSLELFVSNISYIVLLTLIIIIFKFIVVFIILLCMKISLENNVKASILITSIGEYGLLLLSVGLLEKVLDTRIFVILISSIVFSMVVTPILFEFFENVQRRFRFLGVKDISEKEKGKVDVVVVGFGPVGKNLVDFLKSNSISYAVIEMNSETVKKYQESYNIYFGDAKKENILKWIGIENAKLLVITPPILNESLFISEKARSINPNIDVIVRVKFLSEVSALAGTGVEVICDEYEVGNSVIGYCIRKLSLKFE
ncbi:MAG: cation:proton antiporter [Brevinematia bacterium]